MLYLVYKNLDAGCDDAGFRTHDSVDNNMIF